MTNQRFHPVSAIMHWVMFVLIAAALAAIEIRGDIPKGDPLRDTLRNWHMLAGQLVFLCLLVRIAARIRYPAPPALPAPRWQTGSAHLVHGVLYLLMLAIPVTGVLFYQAGGREVNFFGMVLPVLIAPNPDLKQNIREFHELMGNAVYVVVGIHILGALYHQFIQKDGTLLRMLPWKK